MVRPTSQDGSASAFRGGADGGPHGFIPELSFEKYLLSNGLEVVLLEDNRLPLVAVNLWYHVGPANEAPGRTGFAHLFEHMMFQGSKHLRTDSHFQILEAAGASEVNGTTDFDRTNYFETLPSSELELALWLESDRMGYLLERVDEKNLLNQQDVVRNERRQSVENRPYGLAEEALYHLLFPSTHPYYASVIGSHADIQAARLDDVRAFFREFYAPSNATLAIVGDIDREETRRLVEKYFGTLRGAAPVPRRRVETPSISAERRAVVPDRLELPRVYMAWFTSPIFEDGDAEADVAAAVMGGGKSSRLYKKLVYEKQIAQDVRAHQQSAQLASVFAIVATARPGHTSQEIEREIDAELSRFREEGPDPKEIARARNTYETRLLQGLETLGGFGGVADRLNLYNHYLGDPGYLARDLGRYRSVTPASVRTLARERLVTEKRVVLYAVPGEPARSIETPTPELDAPAISEPASVNPPEDWRYERPARQRRQPIALPVPSRFTLPNGLTVLWTERPGLPVVAANLVVRAGGGSNPIAKPGLASFTAAMLDEGAAGLSALDVADEVAQLGASLGTLSTMDATFVSVRALESQFPRALQILADVVQRPDFPPEEIERQRASRLTSLVRERDNPALVAARAMSEALYGSGHPYGFPDLGTEDSVRSIDRDDLVSFWSTHFAPENAALVVAGSLGRERLQELVEKAFGEWKGRRPATESLPVAPQRKARLVLMDKAGAPQTVLRVARVGARRSDPDREALQVLNATLGGLFSSRINLNLRETHGYTYGASSSFAFRREPGPFYVGTSVRADVTAPAVREIFQEIRRFREMPPTDDELERAKAALVRSLPGDFETSASAAGSLSSLFVYDLRLDEYAKYPERVEAVTREAVEAAAEKYLDQDSFVVIAVGDRLRIESHLKSLKIESSPRP